MVTDGLETVGIGLILYAVLLTVRGSVGVATGDYLFRLFRSQIAKESFFLVLDTVTSGIVESVAAIAVVDVLVAQNGDGSGLGLEAVALETTGRTAGTESVTRAAVRRTRRLRVVRPSEGTLLRSGS